MATSEEIRKQIERHKQHAKQRTDWYAQRITDAPWKDRREAIERERDQENQTNDRILQGLEHDLAVAENKERAMITRDAATRKAKLDALEAKARQAYFDNGGDPKDWPNAWKNMREQVLQDAARASVQGELEKQQRDYPLPSF